MDFRYAKDGLEGVEAMAAAVSGALVNGEVLWLVCGGSNIPLTKQAMDIVRTSAVPAALANLTLGLTDERFGPVGHKDSNWQQLIETGFDFARIRTLPILAGKSLTDTASDYAIKLEGALSHNPRVIAQFGIGADGHVAGMLPHTGGISAQQLVFGYEAEPFTRVTITPPVFEKIDEAFAFAFGESKCDAVTRLWQKDLTVEEMPCQILKRIPECTFYSDQI